MRVVKVLCSVTVMIISLGMSFTNAYAISGSDFNAGHIMDDKVFFNSDSMSVSDIQSCLDSKVPNCDTYGAQTSEYGGGTRAQYGAARGNPAPYTCLKDYQEATVSKLAQPGVCDVYTGGTKSAAQIINDVSKACGINPELLLTELQVHQGLVTDDWPWTAEYTNAMGYGCPDNAPCNVSYAGFFDQVYNAASQFKRYTVQPNYFMYQANSTSRIQYSTNSVCGGSDVYIQNKATAALYNYSPYQPNAAALSNLNGTGDSCSSYQNRNIWRYFNEWFGSTLYTSPSASITVNGQKDLTVDYGSSATAAWTSANSSSCNVQPGNYEGLSGTQAISRLTKSTIYIVSCTSPAGLITGSASVHVNPPTFAYVQSYLSALQSKNQALQSVSQQISSAQTFYQKNDIEHAQKTLDKVQLEVDKLVQQSKISDSSGSELNQTIADLEVSL
jgi:hypothetical protein